MVFVVVTVTLLVCLHFPAFKMSCSSILQRFFFRDPALANGQSNKTQNNIILLILKGLFVVLSSRHSHCKGSAVHLMNVGQHQVAADHQTKPTDLDCESTRMLLSSTCTVAIQYYLAQKLMLILPSHAISRDLQKASICNLVCEEHVVGDQCTYNFFFDFLYFSEKYAKFNFCIDNNLVLITQQLC